MKKIILLLLLVLVSVTASARKSYISFGYSSNYYYLNGDIPEGLNGFEYVGRSARIHFSAISPVEILNLLSEYGYELEFIYGNENNYYLVSKEIPSSQTQMKGDVNEDNSVNISDVNELINIILGYVKEHPEILEQIK